MAQTLMFIILLLMQIPVMMVHAKTHRNSMEPKTKPLTINNSKILLDVLPIFSDYKMKTV